MKRSTRYAAVFSSLLTLAAFSRAAADEVRIDAAILTVGESVETPAPAAGVLREMALREGQTLAAGDLVAAVDARQQAFQADVIRHDLAVATRESESDVRVRLAEKEHRVAEAELGRATSVNDDLPNTVSAKEVDRLRLAVERTELEIEHARFERELLEARLGRIGADLRLAEHLVERMRVVAPIDGVVAEVRKRAGEWVSEGETLARVVRVDRLRAEGYLPVTSAMDGLVGRPVTVTTRLPSGETIEATGRVTFVSPEAEPVDAKVRFWAEVDNRALRLRPGLTASVVIHADAPPVAVADTRE